MTDTLTVRRRIGDIETPVGAMLKLGADQAGAFLFESIQGGQTLGRYSFIGLMPEVWFRILDGQAETATSDTFEGATPIDAAPVEALRAFTTRARATSDEALPPMASGAFGYIGYDMIQHVEPVSITAQNELDVPEVLLTIPRVVIIFDHLYQELILVGRVFDGDETAAQDRLDHVERLLASPTPVSPVKDTPPRTPLPQYSKFP